MEYIFSLMLMLFFLVLMGMLIAALVVVFIRIIRTLD